MCGVRDFRWSNPTWGDVFRQRNFCLNSGTMGHTAGSFLCKMAHDNMKPFNFNHFTDLPVIMTFSDTQFSVTAWTMLFVYLGTWLPYYFIFFFDVTHAVALC